MTDKFQIVGSLLRPEESLKYKTQIEHRDDIQYPFYENFEGYAECETEAIKQVVKRKSSITCRLLRTANSPNRCGIWILYGALAEPSVISRIMATFPGCGRNLEI